MSLWKELLRRLQLPREHTRNPAEPPPRVELVGATQTSVGAPQVTPQQSVEASDFATGATSMNPPKSELSVHATEFLRELTKLANNAAPLDLPSLNKSLSQFVGSYLSQGDWLVMFILRCVVVTLALDLPKKAEVLQSAEQVLLTAAQDSGFRNVVSELRSGLFEHRKKIENTLVAGEVASALDQAYAMVLALLDVAKDNDGLRWELFMACSYVENLANQSYEKHFNLYQGNANDSRRGEALGRMQKAVNYLTQVLRIAGRQSRLD